MVPSIFLSKLDVLQFYHCHVSKRQLGHWHHLLGFILPNSRPIGEHSIGLSAPAWATSLTFLLGDRSRPGLENAAPLSGHPPLQAPRPPSSTHHGHSVWPHLSSEALPRDTRLGWTQAGYAGPSCPLPRGSLRCCRQVLSLRSM